MKEKINGILKEKSFCENITPELSLKDDLGLDSLNLVEIIIALESAFGVEFNESDLDPAALKTVKNLYKLLEKYEGVK